MRSLLPLLFVLVAVPVYDRKGYPLFNAMYLFNVLYTNINCTNNSSSVSISVSVSSISAINSSASAGSAGSAVSAVSISNDNDGLQYYYYCSFNI